MQPFMLPSSPSKSYDLALPPLATNLNRFESSDEFAHSGFGDFQEDDRFSCSSFNETKRHFDWGKAKLVRMMSEASVNEEGDTRPNCIDDSLPSCDATVETINSYHSSSSGDSRNSARSTERKHKKKSNRTKETCESGEIKVSSKSSKGGKAKGRKLSPLKTRGRRSKSMDKIPEHTTTKHDRRATRRSSLSNDAVDDDSFDWFNQGDDVHPPPQREPRRKESLDFDMLVKHRAMRVPSVSVSEETIVLQPSKWPGIVQSTTQPVNSPQPLNHIWNSGSHQVKHKSLDDCSIPRQEIVFVPGPTDRARRPSLPIILSRPIIPATKDLAVHMDRILQPR